MSFALTCGGVELARAPLSIPGAGPWFADCDLVDNSAPLPSGKIELVIGDTTLTGTVDPRHTGDFGARRSVRIVAGGGGWGADLPARNYTNDAGIKKADVLAHAAAAAGEVVATVVSGNFGPHYVRSAGPASRTIAECAGDAAWWVDYAGVTQIGKRFTSKPGPNARVLDFDPTSLNVTLAVDSLSDISVGAQLTDPDGRWPGTLTVASLEVEITPESLRVVAWCGAGASSSLTNIGKLVRLLTPQGLFGKYRYRVIRMNGERVDLQVVNKAPGLPDIATVDMWPGISGAHVTLTRGSHVAVSFLDGNRSDPIIDSFIGRAGPEPELIEFGGEGGQGVARQADSVTIPLPPAVLSGVAIIGGSPSQINGVLVFPVGQVTGSITTASAKVKAK